MFERFRIKTALRTETIRLWGNDRTPARLNVEQLFFEPAFQIAPRMKQERWTPEQAMVFMVTDVVLAVDEAGNLAGLAADDPPAWAALRDLYRHVLARAEADPALAGCVSHPELGRPPPFGPAAALAE